MPRPHNKPKIDVTKEGKLAVTKIDAAVRQLETAITLWFNDGDPVSICTLTFAAYQIIHDVNPTFGGGETLLDAAMIRKEYRQDVISLVKSSPNFFKHGSKDPNEIHYFSPESMLPVMAFAVLNYSLWKKPKRAIFQVLLVWIRLMKPQVFSDTPPEIAHLIPKAAQEAALLGKSDFYKLMMPGFEKLTKL